MKKKDIYILAFLVGIFLIVFLHYLKIVTAASSYVDCDVYGNCFTGTQAPMSINYSLVNVNNSLCWQGLCNNPFTYFLTSYTETDPLSLHLTQNNWNLGSNWLTWLNPTLDFNYSKLATIYYNKTEVDNNLSLYQTKSPQGYTIGYSTQIDGENFFCIESR